MAKKGSSMRTLKSLFSRSDANLAESAEKEQEKSDGERKKFRFPKLKTKPKGDAATGSQQVSSTIESSNAAEDGEAWADSITGSKRLSLFGTAPRSKDKEMSYSELDLRKPKRFATFSFNFKKKKKKDEEGMSKSTFILHTQDIEEEEETPQDQANMKRFSMSQPDLDTSMKFDIPSPPPVANNQSDSYFTLTNQDPSKMEEILTNGFDIHEESLVAPIATIPELQLDEPDLSEKEKLPAHVVSSKSDIQPSAWTANAENMSGVIEQPLSGLSSVTLNPTDAINSLASSNKADSNVLQLTNDGSASAVAPYYPPDAVTGTVSSGGSLHAYLDSKINSTPTEWPGFPQSDGSPLGAGDAVSHHEVSISHTKTSVLENAESVASGGAMSEASTPPISPEIVYGTLYESLFPQNFTSELLSSFSKPAPEIQTEIRNLDTRTESVTVRTVSEANFSRAATSYESDLTSRNGDLSLRENVAQENSAEVKKPSAKKDFVMIKTFNERHTETNMTRSKQSTLDEPASGRKNDADDFTRLSSPQIFTEIRHTETFKPAVIEALNETHTETSFLRSHETMRQESDIDPIDQTTDVSSTRVLDDVGLPETRKAIMVKTRYEIDTESNPASTRSSDSVVYRIVDTVNDFTSINDEAGAPPVHTEITQVETYKEPIMIKTITEFSTEDDATQADQSTTYYSRSTFRTQRDAVDGFASASDKVVDTPENVTDEKRSATIKSPVLIKTFSEIYTEANFIHPRKTSDESNSAVCATEVTVDEESANLTEIGQTETSDESNLVKTLNGTTGVNINSRTSTLWESYSTVSTIKDPVDCFTSGVDKTVEISSPPTVAEITRVETRNEPILIKTITEFNTDDGAVNSHLSTSLYSKSTGHTENETFDGFGRSSDKSVEEIENLSDLRHSESKNPTILIKTRSEVHTEANFIHPREITLDEYGSTARETDITMDEKPEDLPQNLIEIQTNEKTKSLIGFTSEANLPSHTSDLFESDSTLGTVKDIDGGFEALGEKTVETNFTRTDTEKINLETENKPVIPKATIETDVLQSQEVISEKSDSAVDSLDGLTLVSGKAAEPNSSQTVTEIRHAETKEEGIPVKPVDEIQPESSITSSDASYSIIRKARDTIGSFVSSQLRRSPETRLRNPPSSFDSGAKPADNSCIPPTQISRSYSEVKSDNSGLVHDTTRSTPVCQPAAPPISDCTASQGTETRVTSSEQSRIPVTKSAADESSGRSPSPPSDSVGAAKGVVLKSRMQRLSDRSGRMDGTDRLDGALSPSYLSIGSDDGSVLEVYYSAEEGNAEESGDEIFTMHTREDGDAGLHENVTQQVEDVQKVLNWKDEGEKELFSVETGQEGEKTGIEDKSEDGRSRDETQPQLSGQKLDNGGTGMHKLLVHTTEKSLEREDATAAQQAKANGEEEEKVRKEELPAPPVQQVKTLMVCDFAPPSSELPGQGEGEEEGSKGKWSVIIETEDHTNDEKQLPSLEGQHLADEGVGGSESERATSGDAGDSEAITPTISAAEKHLSPHTRADEGAEVSAESSGGISITLKSTIRDTGGAAEVATSNVTQRTELQSDATQIEHNRAPPGSMWADPITQSPDRKAQEQVAVEPAEPNEDARRPDPDAAEDIRQTREHPAEDQAAPSEGPLTASRTPATELLDPESLPTESDQESLDAMNSGYSSLSTKLTFRSSTVPKENESKLRFHKVSLIKEDDDDVAPDIGRDTEDFSKTSDAETESNGPVFSSEYKWRNRFEGVSQYIPKTTESSSSTYSLDSLSYSVSDSSYSNYPLSSTSSSSYSYASTLPEATADKHLSNALSTTTSTTSSTSSYFSPSPPSEEHGTLSSQLSDRTVVYLRRESEPAEQPQAEWRRSLFLEREEPAAPAGEGELQREAEREGEPERIKSHWDSEQLPPSHFSSAPQSGGEDDDEASQFTGVFKATLVDLVPEPPAPPSTPPDDDSPSQFDMDNLVDTLKSMGPSMRPRGSVLRPPVPVLVSSLPPIVEDAPSPIAVDVPDSSTLLSKKMGVTVPETNGLYTLPADLGLGRNSRDSRSPLELMKQSQDQQQPGTRNLTLPLRASTAGSIVMRTSSDSSPEELLSPVHNGNGAAPSSRLDNSVLFGSYRSSSVDQPLENGKSHRPLFRTGSLPDTRPPNNRMSSGPKELGEPKLGTDLLGPRSERLSFLMNNLVPSTGSLPGIDDSNSRMSRPPSFGVAPQPASNSPTRVLSPTGSIDLQRLGSITDSPLSMFGQMPGMGVGASPLSAPILQRSFSNEGPAGLQTSLFSNVQGASVGSSPLSPPILQRSFSNEGPAGVQTSLFSSAQGGPLGPSPLSPPILQRSFSNEGPAGVQTSLFSSVQGVPQFQSQEPDRNLVSKYRAFPDAYLTKEKEHGKLNPRPGKMYIFDRPGMCGQRIEIRGDVVDATPWELQETISIRVVRGGWVLYEKPNFKGEKIALDEGDIEITYPFAPPPEEQQQQQQQNGQKEGGEQDGQTSEEQTEAKPARKFIIGSIRRAVRDYSVPEISLFPEENAEGKKVIFRDTSDDARIFGFPIKANSIIINAGLWLVYAQPFFQGVPRVLEVGGYTNPAAWGVEQPYVGSLHPLKVGEPRVENLSEPKVVIYDKPYFTGKSRTITGNMRDFMTRTEAQQKAFMYNVGSMKVLGGIWVGHEKEGFRGHQYLLEEGEYHDWRVWGGSNAELRSMRVIQADLSDPLMVMYEQLEEDQEATGEGNTFEVTEAIPDVELFEYKTSTRSIHVLSGAWVAYSHVDFSGEQYILEKGFYNNCADWGSQDTRICSVQPILLALDDNSKSRNELLLYSEPDFRGECHVFNKNQEALPDKLLTKSCRVIGGSWVLYENKQYSGSMFVLCEGLYPNLTSMGCPAGCSIRSAKVIPMMLSVPSISLFGLECLEGREITMDTEIVSLLEEGFNNHILSVRVNAGCWVICEHSNYRGRQFLLEPIEITNWPKFSSLTTIGSMYPVRQKRHFFRVKNKESGNYLSIQGGVEEMKSGRVVAAPQVEPMSEIWYYQDGLLKNKLSPIMALQVMGNIEPSAKVVLWMETRQPIQVWTAQMRGLITSVTFPGFVLDVKGGKSYDKDHVVIMPDTDERPSQQWEIELL